MTIREENAAAALEVMSRFATDPRWLVYLPPTMAPPATSQRPDLLEHPDGGVRRVPRARGSRRSSARRSTWARARSSSCAATRTVAREPLRRRRAARPDAIYTRTGRPFFDDDADTEAALARVRAAADAAGLWEELATDWLVLDCELLPWSAKAMELIRRQYAAVGAAAHAGLTATLATLEQAAARGLDVG